MFTQYSKFLTEEQRQMVHEASMEVLENTGMLVKAECAREIFKEHGCTVQDDGRVKIPHEVVEKYIKMFPSSYTFTAQDPQFDITIPEQGPCVVTASSAPFVIDPKTRKQRRATSDDIANIARLINQLPGFNVFSISTLADDAPDGDLSLYRFYPALKNCKKPVRSNTPRFSELKKVLELGYTIAGGEEAYRANPIYSTITCPISPLQLVPESTAMSMESARLGIPIVIISMALAGGTTPVTLAGTLLTHNAEALASVVLSQATVKGAPVVYGSSTSIMDLKYTCSPVGCPELGMINASVAKLAQFYGIPSWVAGG